MKDKIQYCIVLALLLVTYRLVIADDNCCVSHQFVPRSITTDLAYTNMLNYYNRYQRDNRQKFIYSGNFIYQKSNKSDTLGSAFLLKNGNSCVNVLQNSLGNNPPTDINSYWLGLVNTNPANPFASQFCIKPERRVFSYYNYFFADLSDLWCGLWLDVAFAVLSVTHKLNSCAQGNDASVCPAIPSVCAALNNPLYAYGKFNCCNEQHRAGVDDVQVRLGYEYTSCEDIYGGAYLIGTVPTGRNNNAEYIFEPIIGSKHGSLGVGGNVYYTLCSYENDNNLALLFDANYRYVFGHTELRSFDLSANGALSRYLLVVDEDNAAAVMPGINFFTQNAQVVPQSTLQAWLALHYQRCNYDIEAGYNFFWRQAERINCTSTITRDIGIEAFDVSAGVSASTARISQGPSQITRDASFVNVTSNNFNLCSAAAQRALSNKLYGIVSTNRCICAASEISFAFGGSYEFVSSGYKCSTLPYWAVFGQVGLLF